MDDPTGLTFTEDGKDVYVANRSSAEIFVFRSVGPGASPALVLDAQNGISDPVAMASVSGHLLVVSAAQRTVRVYGLPALNQLDEIQLDVEPQGMQPVAQSSLYLLNARSKATDSLWMIDAKSGIPVFFVPGGE
jgi:hypothetical protein